MALPQSVTPQQSMLSYRVYNQVSYKIPDWISNSFSKCVKKNVALKTYEIQKSTVLYRFSFWFFPWKLFFSFENWLNLPKNNFSEEYLERRPTYDICWKLSIIKQLFSKNLHNYCRLFWYLWQICDFMSNSHKKSWKVQ